MSVLMRAREQSLYTKGCIDTCKVKSLYTKECIDAC